MPPITRNQVKKSSLKTEPYSKENRPTEKRTALLDIIENNVSIIIFNCITYFYYIIFYYFLTIHNLIHSINLQN